MVFGGVLTSSRRGDAVLADVRDPIRSFSYSLSLIPSTLSSRIGDPTEDPYPPLEDWLSSPSSDLVSYRSKAGPRRISVKENLREPFGGEDP